MKYYGLCPGCGLRAIEYSRKPVKGEVISSELVVRAVGGQRLKEKERYPKCPHCGWQFESNDFQLELVEVI